MTIGERIKKGRTMRGLSLRKLGEMVGLSHTQISNLEKGLKGINGPQLIAISKALNLPYDYFVNESRVVSEEGKQYRKIKSIGTKESDKIEGAVEYFIENYIELEELMGVEVPFTKEYLPKIDIRSAQDIEQIAQIVRQKYELGQAPIPNVTSLLENMGIKVVSTKGKKGFDGVSYIANNTIPIVAYNKESLGIERRRMTLLHELAHLLIGEYLIGLPDKEVESACTAFASYLLLPTEVLREYFGGRRKRISLLEFTEIQGMYGISTDAIVYRLREMLFISEGSYRSYFINIRKDQKLREHLEESRFIEPESNRFERLVIRALDDAMITESRAMVYLASAGYDEDTAKAILNPQL